MRCAFALSIACVSIVTANSVNAATLYYGGDPTTANSGYQERSAAYNWDIFYFAPVTVPANQTWTVTGLTAINGNGGGAEPSSAHYDFRQGTTSGSLGTLVTSGDVSVTISPTTGLNYLNGGNVAPEQMTATLPTPIVLASGQTYYFTFSAIAPSGYHQFVGGGSASSSVNAPGLPSYQYFSYSAGTTVTQTFTPTSGLVGTIASAPEPTTLASLALAGLLVRRRRR